MAINFPLINGNRMDFSSVDIIVAASRMRGIKSIDYSQSLTPGKVRGTGAQKLGRTRGEHDADASLEIYMEEFGDLVQLLGAGGIVGYMEANFDVIVTYAEFPSSPVQTVNIHGARMIKHEQQAQQGSDPLTMKLSLDVMYVLINGVPPLSFFNK